MSSNAGFQLFPAPPTTAVSPKRNGKGSANHSRKPSGRHAIQPRSPAQSAVERSQSSNFQGSGSRDVQQQYDMSGRLSPFPNGGQDRGQTPKSQQQYSQFILAESSRSQTSTANAIQTSGNAYPQSQFRPQTPLAQINTSTSPTSSPPRQTTNEPPAIKSIFPTYNQNIRLEHQDYYPTVHIGDERMREIPRAVMSKSPYSPSISEQSVPSLPSMRNQLQRNPSLVGTSRVGSPSMKSPVQSRNPYGNGPSNASVMSNSPPLHQGPTSFHRSPVANHNPIMDQASSTEELKDLWKVTNGWRVSASEGRTFALQMTSDPEEPVHILSSDTDPFYTLRIEPTSTSAHLTMTRHDPSKAASTSSPTSKLKSGLGLSSKSTSSTPTKGQATNAPSKSRNGATSPSGGIKAISHRKKGKGDDTIEVLTTTLEETHRRLPPNDGLVALLYPSAASALVISHHLTHPNTPSHMVRAMAERECARLIWDQDSQHYYLSHPCLSQPFIIRITKIPAWSKIEYVLEHPALPNDLARLVRGAGGTGMLIVDTGTAGGLDGVFIVDVAVCALLVVTVTEEKLNSSSSSGSGAVERFEGPPSPKFLFDEVSPSGGSIKSPRLSLFMGGKKKQKGRKKGKRESGGMQDFEVDLESQDSFKEVGGTGDKKAAGKKTKKTKEEKGSFVIRVFLFGVRCIVWVFWGILGCLLSILVALGRCLVGKEK